MDRNNDRDDMHFESLLKNAVCEFHERELEDLPDNGELAEMYELSDDFYKRIALLIRVEKKKKWYGHIKRTLRYAAAVLLLIGALLAVNEDVRAKIKDVIVEWFDEYISFRFTNEAENTIDFLEDDIRFEITYLPDGYELVDRNVGELMGTVEYGNKDGKSIIFKYYLGENSLSLSIDNDDKEITELILESGEQAYYSKTESEDKRNNLMWIDSGRVYSFTLKAELDIDEMIKIANSVKK